MEVGLVARSVEGRDSDWWRQLVAGVVRMNRKDMTAARGLKA